MVRLLLLVFVSLLAREVSAARIDFMIEAFERSDCVQPIEPDVCRSSYFYMNMTEGPLPSDTCLYSPCCNGLDEIGEGEEGTCKALGDIPVLALGEACVDKPSCGGVCDYTNGAICENSVCVMPSKGPFFCACSSDADCNTPTETCQTLGTNRVIGEASWCLNAEGFLPHEPSADTLEGDRCFRDWVLDSSTCGEGFLCWPLADDTSRCHGVKIIDDTVEASKSDGEDCSYDSQCQSDWCEYSPNGWFCRTPAQGAACDGYYSCGPYPNSYCNVDTPETCLVCLESVCEVQAALGEDCSRSMECIEGTYCDLPGGQCTAQKTVGAACENTLECTEELECEGAVCTAYPSPVSGAACTYYGASTYHGSIKVDECMEGESCNNIDKTSNGVCAVLTKCHFHNECGATEKCAGGSYSSQGVCLSEGLAVDGESCDESPECAVDLACIMTLFSPAGGQTSPRLEGVCGVLGSGHADGDECQISRVDAVCGGQFTSVAGYTDSCNDGSVCMMSGSIEMGKATTLKCVAINAVALADGSCPQDEDGFSRFYKTFEMNGVCTDGKIGSPCKVTNYEVTDECAGEGTYCNIPQPLTNTVVHGGVGVCAAGPILEGEYCFGEPSLCADDLTCDEYTWSFEGNRYGTLDHLDHTCKPEAGSVDLAEGESCDLMNDLCAKSFYCACVGNEGKGMCVSEDKAPDLCAAEDTAREDYIKSQCSEGGPRDSRTEAQQTCTASLGPIASSVNWFDKDACYDDLDQDKLDKFTVMKACCWVCRHTDTLTTLSDLVLEVNDQYDSSYPDNLLIDFGSVVDCTAGTITRALKMNDFCLDLDISDVFVNCPAPTKSPTSAVGAPTNAPTKSSAPTEAPTSVIGASCTTTVSAAILAFVGASAILLT